MLKDENIGERSSKASATIHSVLKRRFSPFSVLALGLVMALVSARVALAALTASVTLGWDPPADPSVVGYKVYYGVASRTYTNVVPVSGTSVTINGLVVGVTYYFAVTSVNSFGQESDLSEEISYRPTAPGNYLATLRLSPLPANRMQLSCSGPAGYSYDVQASQDLANWSTIGTVRLDSNGAGTFTDKINSRRYYRLRQTSP